MNNYFYEEDENLTDLQIRKKKIFHLENEIENLYNSDEYDFEENHYQFDVDKKLREIEKLKEVNND